MLAHLRDSGADLWAATDSLSWGRHHLQSYFLALGPRARAVLLPLLRRRLELHAGLSKVGLIQRFEVGMTRDAVEAGLELDVFRSVRDVLSEPERVELARYRPQHPASAVITNLTHHLWRGMLREHGLPFLKVELLRDNPLGIDVSDWQGELDPDWAGVIERHLTRIRRTAP
jgi:rhamnosyltransferase